MKLFTANAPYPHRVNLFVASKDIDIETIWLDVLEGETRSDEHRERNSLQEVPVLELDDGLHLSESFAICRFLESQFPHKPLFGSDARESALIDMWSHRMEQQICAPIGAHARHSLALFADRVEQIPAYAQSNLRLQEERWAWLDEQLSDGRRYIVDDKLSFADLVGSNALLLSDILNLPIPGELTHVRRWEAAMRRLEGWQGHGGTPDSDFVDHRTWLDARLSLLNAEKQATRQRDLLARQRRNMPQTRVQTDYSFETDRGQETLEDLFKGHSQLIVYHFMFGEDWEEGCPSCSFWMDNFDGIDVHLAARDTRLVVCSSAELPKLLAYRARMGWCFDWVSSGNGPFNRDFGVTFPNHKPGPTRGYNHTGRVFGEEMPGISVFKRHGSGRIGHSYSTHGRGLDGLNGTYQLLDLTPEGRQEDALKSPMSWVRRHDQYD